MLGKIEKITTVNNFSLGNYAKMNGNNGSSLGFSGMLSILGGGREMDGYEVKTDKHRFLILIDNQSSCCESFGYLSTPDDVSEFVGSDLREISLTDGCQTTEKIEELEYLDAGGVQFVTFKTDKGDFQLAVYNGHNGYYGHGIIISRDDEILLQDTL